MNERKLAFYEIGKNGNYASIMQAEFEKAQQSAMETGRAVTGCITDCCRASAESIGQVRPGVV